MDVQQQRCSLRRVARTLLAALSTVDRTHKARDLEVLERFKVSTSAGNDPLAPRRIDAVNSLCVEIS